MKVLQTIESALVKAESALIILLLGVMLLLGFTQVILRNVFHSGIIWADIVLRHLVLWVGFLGALLAAYSGKHISVDAFTRFFVPKVRTAITIVTDFFAAVVCYFLLRASLTFISFEISDKYTIYENIPSWYAQSIIPIGYTLLIFHFTVRVIRHSQHLIKGEAS